MQSRDFYLQSDISKPVEFDRFIGICNVHFLHIAFLCKLFLLKNITYVLGNNSPISLK